MGQAVLRFQKQGKGRVRTAPAAGVIGIGPKFGMLVVEIGEKMGFGGLCRRTGKQSHGGKESRGQKGGGAAHPSILQRSRPEAEGRGPSRRPQLVRVFWLSGWRRWRGRGGTRGRRGRDRSRGRSDRRGGAGRRGRCRIGSGHRDPGHLIALGIHALREGIVILLLDRQLGVLRRSRAGPGPDDAPGGGADAGSPAAADGGAQAGAEDGAQQGAPDRLLIGFIRLALDLALGELFAKDLVFLKGLEGLVRAPASPGPSAPAALRRRLAAASFLTKQRATSWRFSWRVPLITGAMIVAGRRGGIGPRGHPPREPGPKRREAIAASPEPDGMSRCNSGHRGNSRRGLSQ